MTVPHFELSPAQLDIYLDQRRLGVSPMYNIGGILVLRSRIDSDAWSDAYQQMLACHDVLHLQFREVEGEPRQFLHPRESALAVLDFCDHDEPRLAATRWAQDAMQTPFDVGREFLHRSALLYVAHDETWYFSVSHHLVCDGWSYALWARELVARYCAVSGIEASPVRQAGDFLAQLNGEGPYLESRAARSDGTFWAHLLPDETSALGPRNRNSVGVARSSRCTATVSPERFIRWADAARGSGSSINQLLTCGTALYVSRLTGNEQVVVGVPSHNRRGRQKHSLGLFTTVNPVPVDCSAKLTSVEMQSETGRILKQVVRHRRYPLSAIASDRGLQPGQRLFDVQLNYQKLDYDAGNGAFSTATHFLDTGHDQTPLVFTVCDYGPHQDVVLHVDGNSAWFSSTEVQQACERFASLLDALSANPERPLHELDLLTAEDARCLSQWGGEATGPEGTLLERIEARVDVQGDATAVVCGEASLSYGELWRRSGSVAAALVARGVTKEARVGVCAGRSVDLVVALLGVLRAGAAYVPLDPSYPAERVAFMLEDSGAQVVVTTAALASRFEDALVLETVADADAPAVSIDTRTLAYLIYTSGSTGRPKGVCIEHGQAATMVGWALAHYAVADLAVVAAGTSICFDLSVFELFVPLSAGTTVQVLESPVDIAGLAGSGVTLLNTVPSAMRALLDADAVPSTVRVVNLAGEALTRSLADAVYAGGVERLYNLYGPSEDTTYSTWSQVSRDSAEAPRIGVPLTGTEAQVVDRDGRALPPGAVGELWLSGAGVARGYWDRPELTAERFVEERGRRWYRTGDRVRWADGELIFLGRMDHQVKVRGFRIEPGEIASALERVAGVREAAVVARGSEDVELVAYVVGVATESDCLSALREALPEYMIPAHLLVLESLPRTPNGKLDRSALPAPDVSASAYEAPRTADEQALAELWEELLGVDPVGRQDRFFALGGHSLLALRLLGRIARQWSVEIELGALFESPTLADLAALLGSSPGARRGPLTAGQWEGEQPLSYAQERLWFIDRLEGSTAYHMPARFRVHERLDVDRLQQAVRLLEGRHAILRTVYREDDGEGRQAISESARCRIEHVDLRGLDADAQSRERAAVEDRVTRTPYDLSGEGPLRLALVDDDGGQELLFCLHHIAGDGWSMEVLLRELDALYGDRDPGAVPVQYVDYVHWQRGWLTDAERERQRSYWEARLADLPTVHSLPLDHARPRQPRFEGARHTQRLDARVRDALKTLARTQETTLFGVLHSAFAVLLSRYGNTTDIVMGTPVAGRADPALDAAIGFFVNTLVLRSTVDGGESFATLVRTQHGHTAQAFAHADLPFAQLVEALQPERSRSHSPLFQILFALQSLDTESLALGGQPLQRAALAHEVIKCDLELHAVESDDGLRLEWVYDRALFNASTIAGLAETFAVLLRAVTREPERPLHELDLLTAEDARCLSQWGGEATGPEGTLLERIEARVDVQGDAMAVVCGEASLSYGELWRRSGSVAAALVARGVTKEARVGVCAGRSVDLMVALLGVLRAGAAYVPLDPSYPAERVAFMLEDSGAQVVVTTAAQASRFEDALVLETVADADAPAVSIDTRTLAYLIYTSGSTGRPKGVCIEHGQAATMVGWALAHYAVADLAVVAAGTSICFDLSVFELFVPLSAGTTVQVLESPVDIAGLAGSGATLLNTVPSAMRALLDADAVPSTVRVVNLAGEALTRSLADAVYAGGVERLYNLYGPSEDTTYSTWSQVSRDSAEAPRIGVPLTGTEAQVVDRDGRALPPGAVGELWLSGAGVARGYWDRPELTAERFVEERGRRWYRTGDRVRWADGELIFLGRMDHQVKVRGFRIEPGEIASALERVAGVREAAVIARGSEDVELVAYVVGAVTESDCLSALREALPEYMIPAHLLVLESLPRTPNGKLDRSALPAPDVSASAYEAPRTADEQALAELWEELLGVDPVGRQDRFFALGGHSLLALRLLGRIARQWSVEIELGALFESPTLADLAALLGSSPGARRGPLTAGQWEGEQPLSYAQERLWFIDRLEGSTAYHMPARFRVHERLDVDRLQQAVRLLEGRHAILRTVYREDDGEGRQAISESARCRIEHVDLRGLDADAQSRERAAVEDRVTRTPYDLSGEGPLRLALVDDDGGQELLFCLHHIAGDGWSMEVLLRELDALYGDRDPGAVPVQYVDYVHWQRGWLTDAERERQRSYWEARLADLPTVHSLPLDHARPRHPRFEGARHTQRLDARVRDALKTLARTQETTLFGVLHSAFAVLLSRYGNTTDIVVGTPVAGRADPALDAAIGFFVNTLVLRSAVDGGESFATLVRTQHGHTAQAFAHADLPFAQLVEALQPERSRSHSPLFQILFALQSLDTESLALGGQPLQRAALAHEVIKCDLELHAVESDDGLRLEWVYDRALFNASTIAGLAETFAVLLRAVTREPERPLHELDLLTAEDARCLSQWGGEATGPEGTLLERIEARVDVQGDATAVVCGEASLSYGELWRRSGSVAAALVARGVTKEARVGVCAGRSVDLVVALLGVLRAGAAYVPLDPSYPAERVAFMLEDSGAQVVVTTAAQASRFEDALVLETVADADAPAVSIDARTLAYLIYTSGSTGRPKGVCIEHGAMIRLRDAMRAIIPTLPVVIQAAPVAFDASVFEIWVPLMEGGRVVLYPHDTMEMVALNQSLIEHDVDTAFLTSGLFEAWSESRNLEEVPLQIVITGGDVVSPAAARAIYDRHPSIRLFNAYGPTENCVFSTWYEIPRSLDSLQALPIGAPISGTCASIVDRALRPLPVGAIGELLLGGSGIARGYWQRPELNDERFLASGDDGGRWYRTGDLCRWNRSGRLEFHGRADQQVKVRGFRIEPGEIERVMRLCEGVRDSAVIAIGSGASEKMLVGYLVAAHGDLSTDRVRAVLNESLPEYMIPAHLLLVDDIPLTANGKPDRAALPMPSEQPRPKSLPTKPVEREIAALWSDLLNIDEPGVDESFFGLGGHSLLAMRLASRMESRWGICMPLRQIFESPTVAQLATYIENADGSIRDSAILRMPGDGPYPLSRAQYRLWFIDSLEGSTQYHVTTVFSLRGEVDHSALEQATFELMQRHRILRTVYRVVDGTPVQQTLAEVEFAIDSIDWSDTGAARQSEMLDGFIDRAGRQPFALDSEPPLRVSLIKTGDDHHLLVVTLHHIATDGWSTTILMQDLAEIYGAARQNSPVTLPALPVEYSDFCYWEQGQIANGALTADLDWWTDQLTGIPPMHSIVTDYRRPAAADYRRGVVRIALSTEQVGALEYLARECDTTVFCVLHAAFTGLLYRWSGADDIGISVPVAGRSDEVLDRVAGLFVNTLVLRSRVNKSMTFRDLVKQSVEFSIAAFEKQQVPFESVIEALAPTRVSGMNPVSQIKFVLQNFERFELSLDGLDIVEMPRDDMALRFDLDLTGSHVDGRILLDWSYRLCLFSPESIRAMSTAFDRLVSQIADEPDCPVSGYSLLSSSETRSQKGLGQGKLVEAPSGTILEPLQLSLTKARDTFGVVAGNASIDAANLWDFSGRLARFIADQGIGNGDRVGVLVRSHCELLVALIGVLRSGAAYVPLSADGGGQRVATIVEDAGIEFLIGDPAGLSMLGLPGVDVLAVSDIDLNSDWLEEYANESDVNLPDVAADDVAYVMYTSGSTGVPKGVEVTHGGLVDYCRFAQMNYYGEAAGSLVVTSPAFDITIPSLYVPLLRGGTVELAAEEDALSFAARRLGDADLGPQLLRMTPMHVQGLLGLLPDGGLQRHVFVVGGEAFSPDLARALQSRFPNSQIYNHYGPTETVVGCAMYDVTANGAGESDRLPIGRPMDNTVLYVLDEHGEPVPEGVPGELYIGGAGVARGYVNRPDLTAQKFVANRFADPGAPRLYRSGDRVRWNGAGDLEFCGRMDDQVKVRGYRIEPGEIASVLRQVSGVRDAVVIARGEAEQRRLLAYAVMQAEVETDTTQERLRSVLKERLPDYMVPSSVMILESLPLSANGKVDRRALPEPEHTPTVYEAPATQTEELVAQVWSEVLGHERVSVSANFFDLGGHSLLATRVIGAISQRIEKRITVRTLFEAPTVRELSRVVDLTRQVDFEPIPRLGSDQPRVLSFAQQRLWFIDQLEGGSSQYNMPTALRLTGPLDPEALKSALNALVARHLVLRTVYQERGGEVCQVVLPETSVALIETTLPAVESGSDAAINSMAAEDARTPFDLQRDLMLRVSLIVVAKDDHVLLINMHHIASDGWSRSILVREFAHLYNAAISGQPPSLPELAVTYGDFAQWQRQRIESSRQADLEYWHTCLTDVPVCHALALDRQRPVSQSYHGQTLPQRIPPSLTSRLKRVCRDHDASLFMVLHALFSVFVARWGGSRDVVIGTPVAGRTHPHVEPLIGFFVNTVVLRSDVDLSLRLEQWIERSRQLALDAFDHQELPFEDLVESLKIDRSLSHNPLFQIMFSLRNNNQADLRLPGLSLQEVDIPLHTSKFDLELVATERDDGIDLSWIYATDLFERATVERMALAFERLLSDGLGRPDTPLSALRMLADEDYSRQLRRRGADVHDDGPVNVAQRILQAPEGRIRCASEELDHDQLSGRALDVARMLVQRGVERGDRIAVLLDGTPSMLVAQLGVLLSGAAYVPLDPAQPLERRRHILDDAQPRLVLGECPDLTSTLFACVPAGQWYGRSDVNLPDVAADDVAYVMYTSGSTGVPKGVEVTHGGLVDYCRFAQMNYYGEAAGSLVVTSPAFDITIPSLYVPLLRGGTVELAAEEDALSFAARRLGDADLGPQLLRMTPMHVQGLLSLLPDGGLQRHVFVVGGEAFSPDLARALQSRFPNSQIYNHYGPTETVVGCAMYDVTANGAGESDRLPIGRPMDNTVLYVLDEHGEPVPEGVPGELYIGGAGVARGYVNRPDLTAQKFVANRFADPGAPRLYRSGDRVRWNGAGDLEFCGRMDDQVKVRGYRIEPGEIASVLRQVSGVRDAVVIARGEAEQRRLLAYAVMQAEVETDTTQERLRSVLKERLPDYMVPSSVMILESLPLSANGKVDRRALPEPEHTPTVYEAPATQTEELVAQVWSEVLGQERVSVSANFFDLGGHSLLATRVIGAISQRIEKRITVRTLFEAPTVRELSRVVDLARQVDFEPIPRLGSDQPRVLSFAQQRLWFIDQLEGGSSQYNMPTALRLTGPLDREALQRAAELVAQRHEVLLTSVSPDGRPRMSAFQITVDRCDVSQERLQALIVEEASRAFDLAAEAPWRLKLLQLAEDDHVLLSTVHHIASDGWSRSVWIREFVAAYSAICSGASPAFPELPIQYSDYAAWQRRMIENGGFRQHEDYWSIKLSDAPEVHGLPLDKQRPPVQSHHGDRVNRRLDRSVTESIQRFCRQHNASPFMVLEAAMVGMVHRWSGDDDIVIGTPVAGRQHPELENLVGLFVNTVVLRTPVRPGQGFANLVEETRALALDAFDHQVLPFDLVVENLRPQRSLSYSPIFQLMFSMRNHPRSEWSIDDLRIAELSGPEYSSKFDLELVATERDGGIDLSWIYATDLFERATVERMALAFERLLSDGLGRPDTPLSALRMLADEDYSRQLRRRGADVHDDGPVSVAQRILQAPEGRIRCASEELDHDQLSGRALDVARMLVQRGVERGDRIAVLLDGTPSMLVAQLGVLLSGAAYVPLDPAQPLERRRHILDDAQPRLVLGECPDLTSTLFACVPAGQWYGRSDVNLPDVAADDVAYVMYTSGSTGVPKGVEVTHGGLVDYCRFAQMNYYGEAAGSLVVTSPAFDITIPSLYVPLLRGGTVELAAEEDALSFAVRRLGDADLGPQLLRMTPMHVQGLLSLLPDGGLQRHVFVVGGEAFSPDLARALQSRFPNSQIYNHYGPTETVVGCAMYDVTANGAGESDRLPIGRPMDNTVLYVLDEHGEPVPEGVPGELYIGGAGVARGYVNRPDLTAQKFVANRFADPGAPRLYRSGDRVRWNGAGDLEFCGRMDDQVKVRGYRIEPGEIASVLRQVSGVRDAVVIARGEAEQRRLLAYAVMQAEVETDTTQERLRSVLKEQLPDYMVPSSVMILESLPLSANGKVDRRALPEPEHTPTVYEAPVTQTEELVAQVWSEVLGQERVSVSANFFDLGGHSLLATQVMLQLRQKTDRAISLRQLFERQTVRDIAKLLDELTTIEHSSQMSAKASAENEMEW